MNELAILDAIRLIHTPWLDTIVAAYTSTSDVGQIWILLGIVLAIIPKTRKLGAAVLIAVLLGAIVTSGILKPLIMRPRPCAFGNPHSRFPFCIAQLPPRPLLWS